MQTSARKFRLLLGLAALTTAAVVSAQLSPEDAMAKMKAKAEARKTSTQPAVEDLAVVRSINADLKKENTTLKTDNASLKADNERLKDDNDKLRKELAELKRAARGSSGKPGSTIFDGIEKETKAK